MDVNGVGPVRPLTPTAAPAVQENTALIVPTMPVDPAGGAAGPVGPKPKAELQWQPIDVDLNTVDLDVPDPPMWDYGDKPLQGRTFTSWGDPHEISGDGLKFDNIKRGEFVKLMSATGDFILQTRQDPWVRNANVTINAAAAVKLGNDLVTFDMVGPKFMINGRAQALTPGQDITLPGGGTVKVTKDGIQMVSAKGDKVNIEFKENYIDIRGEVSAQRKDGEIRGSLGSFDNDTDAGNDLKGRTGNGVAGNPNDEKSMDAFLEMWRANGGDSLFKRSEDLEFYHDNFEGKELSPMLYDYFLRNYDQNGDGDITQTEFLVMRAADRAISGGDTNRDGKIMGKELNEWAKSERWRDRNGDGTMTAAEFLQASMGWNVLADLRRDMEAQRKKREEEDAKKQAGKPA